MKGIRILSNLILCFMALLPLISCEDEITPDLEEAPAIVSVDAWINNKDEDQVIRVTTTQPYFDNTLPPPVRGATVRVEANNGTVYNFTEQEDGSYVWSPSGGFTFGVIGLDYELIIEVNNRIYTASSSMNRVPTIDSVTFRFEEENTFLPDSYFAEFWSRDPIGAGDTYWIKSYKNGQLLNQPDEINIAYDAGFSEGGNIDGLIFIPPIRDAINPFEEDENDEFLSPFDHGDEVFVEIYSITNESFTFLNEMVLQINRPGGFAELFATPLSNVPTNINSSDPNERVVGFFNVSAVESNGAILDVSQVPRED